MLGSDPSGGSNVRTGTLARSTHEAENRRGGRPHLSASVRAAFCLDFEQHGQRTIDALRIKDPSGYLKLCLQIIAKADEPATHTLAGLSDDELDYLERLLAERRAAEQDQGRAGEAGAGEQARGLRSVPEAG